MVVGGGGGGGGGVSALNPAKTQEDFKFGHCAFWACEFSSGRETRQRFTFSFLSLHGCSIRFVKRFAKNYYVLMRFNFSCEECQENTVFRGRSIVALAQFSDEWHCKSYVRFQVTPVL